MAKFKVGDTIIIPPPANITPDYGSVMAIIHKIDYHEDEYHYTFLTHWDNGVVGSKNKYSISMIDEKSTKVIFYNRIWNELNAHA